MTEFSMFPWETQTGTGDGEFAYTQVQANNFFRYYDIRFPDAEGIVMSSSLNQLEVTGTTSPLTVDTGVAYCYGRYWNDDTVDLTITTPGADTGGIVKLVADWSANEIRVALELNTSGVTTPPTITQTYGTLWELSLATFVVDNAGDVWTDATKTTAGVTDTRFFIRGANSQFADVRPATSATRFDSGYGGFSSTPDVYYPDNQHVICTTLIESFSGGTSINGIINFPNGFSYDDVPFCIANVYTQTSFNEHFLVDARPSKTGISFNISTADGSTSFDTVIVPFIVWGPYTP